MQGTSPLTSADHGKLNKAMAALNQAVHEADLMEAAGFEVGEKREMIDYFRQRIEQIRTVYSRGGNQS